MLGAREAAQVRANFGQEDLRGAAPDAGHGIRQVDLSLVFLEPRGDLGADPVHSLLQVVQVAQVLGDHEGVVRTEPPDDRLGQQVALGP